MKILGISAYYHDSAIALLEDDDILFAIQEERLSRKKGDERFPAQSIKAALSFLNRDKYASAISGGGGRKMFACKTSKTPYKTLAKIA